MIHEGVDVESLGALERGQGQRPDILPNDPEIEVLTYVSRGFEEYRGFPRSDAGDCLAAAAALIFMS